jgi:VWFA-related protein
MTLAAGVLPGQEKPPVFQTGVSQVRVDVEVLSGGRPVPKLLAQHFMVKDNGAPQKVLHVSQNEDPLDVILLFDGSGSMKMAVERVSATALKAMEHLRAGDRIAVMTFATRPRLIAGFTEDHAAVQRTIEQDVLGEPFEGWTRIVDAAGEAGKVHFRQGRTGRRRAVLVITDNYGQQGKLEEDQALEDLLEADVILCGVIIPNPREARRTKRPLRMDHLAQETGGDTLAANDPGEGFGEMMERLRSRYSIYYAMPQGEAGEFRSVRVELQGAAKQLYPEARVFARKGYKLP